MEKDNENVVSSAEKEQVTDGNVQNSQEETQNEKMYSRSELNKILNAERNKLKNELTQEFETKKSEAEKLAKMGVEEKLNYELNQKKEEIKTLNNQLNSLNLKSQANSYASEKGLPLGYIEDFNYAEETAETIKEKIDKLVQLRSKDLDVYLKEKLKQPSPKAIEDNNMPKDPYLQGFNNYMKKKK